MIEILDSAWLRALPFATWAIAGGIWVWTGFQKAKMNRALFQMQIENLRRTQHAEEEFRSFMKQRMEEANKRQAAYNRLPH